MGGFLPMIVALVVTLSVEVPIDRRIEQWTVTTLPRQIVIIETRLTSGDRPSYPRGSNA